MRTDEKLVAIYDAANATEAHLVANFLLDEGIEAFVTEENDPLANLPCGSAHVMIGENDQLLATRIVESYQASLIQRGERPDWICSECQATVCGAEDECTHCGADRPGSELMELDDEG